MKNVKIDDKTYQVLQNEFTQCQTAYSTLHILDKVGEYDNLISLISNISNKLNCKSAIFGSATHGGYIPINCSIKTNFLFDCSLQHQNNISANIENNKQYIFLSDLSIINEAFVRRCILHVDLYHEKYNEFVLEYRPIVISNKPFMEGFTSYKLSNQSNLFVLVPNHLTYQFASEFLCYIDGYILQYDNLINLCVMVKNGGDAFVSMLETALPFIDKWTILDTGSTDNTVSNVTRVMAGKSGALYQEAFINFGVSRNRCLELAGTSCVYNIMLDDTYHLKGDIRAFLKSIRGDQIADSFSLYITQPDIQYASNRIFKSKRNLKYKYAIHEVIQETNNVNIIIPKENAYIYDFQTEELNVRTINRKEQDLRMLQEEIDENPDDPRSYYYMAQTYSGLGQYEKAYEWFLKRIHHSNTGFEQEKHEACLEAGRIAQFTLKMRPDEFLKHYELAHVVDPERPDALYFLGAYYIESDARRAFNYLWKGFKLGFPSHRQYCLKPSITYTHIPSLLTSCCYNLEEYQAGHDASAFYLENNKLENDQSHSVVLSWNKIFALLVHSFKIKGIVGQIEYPLSDKPTCCFIAPCRLYNWTGSDILHKSMGGSESMIVELATNLQARGCFNVIVFCNCDKIEIYENVRYIPLPQLFYTLHSQFIHTCIISRYSEYLPVVIKSDVENVFLMAHDTAFSGNVITINQKLKGVICLSQWHADHMLQQFPALSQLIRIVGHGIDASKLVTSYKIPYKFIYSSLANRGLRELLLFWPKILQWQPSATLHIYSSIDSQFMLDLFGNLMSEIRQLLEITPNVVHHGTVDKKTLYEAWKTADVWLYPTSFNETFCVTALEAAASKTLAIATNLAGLKETVSNRGVLFDMLDENIIKLMKDEQLKKELIDSNHEWAINNTWDKQTAKLEEMLMVNRFEHRGVVNWCGDPNARTVFIDMFKQNLQADPKLLEVGVGTGISLLTMLSLFEGSSGVAIYDSDHKLRRSFDVNVIHSGFKNRIREVKHETVIQSLMLLLSGSDFDAIYFNNNNDLLDCYAEMMVAWQILKIGGLLIIENLLDKRIVAVQHLLDKCKNSKCLFMDKQRTFIKKV